MNALFSQAAQAIDLPWIRELKQGGVRIVGYTCSFVPVEVFYAAGIVPVRLRGIGTDSLSIGDAYYGPFVCTFPKALLQQAGQGAFGFLDGVVVTSGCDGMRRLDECWRKMSEEFAGTLPDWFMLLDVPHKPGGVGLEWYQSRIRQLIRAVEEHFKVIITDDRLHQAIREQNRVREKIWALDQLRTQAPSYLTGVEAFQALIARTVLPRDLYLSELTALVEDVKTRRVPVSEGKTRLFVTGSICDDLDLIREIETRDAIVVGENVCYGMRNTCERVSEEGDPVAALSLHYLSGSVCPRMFGYYPMRRDSLIDRIRATSAQAVVMQNIRFCDLHGSENGLLERDLGQMGIACLRIEKEYGALTEKGRLRLRLDAFLEQLRQEVAGPSREAK